jgi:hypothetical protein
MSLPTILRPAKASDCEDIYQAHLYAVRYTCSSTYNETILTAWSVLLSPESYLETMALPHQALWVIVCASVCVQTRLGHGFAANG